MPSKTLVRQIDMEIGEARQGIRQLEAEVTRLETAREALVPGESNGKAPAKRRSTRRTTARRKTTRTASRPRTTARAPGSATRLVAVSLLRMNGGEPFTVPAFYAEHGEGNWNELTTFNIFKRLQSKGMLEKAGKDGNTQQWRVKDREKLGELAGVAA